MVMLPIFEAYRHEIAVSILGSLVIGVIALPIRKVKNAWVDLTNKLDAVHVELATQRNNCLTTLQAQGETQIALLTKIADALGEMRLDAKETAGFLRGRDQK